VDLLLWLVERDIAEKDPVSRVQVNCPTVFDGFTHSKTEPLDVLSNRHMRFGGVLFHAAPDRFWV
jgi:hypothetical protein